MKDKFLEALKELRKEKKRGFTQTVELIINLAAFDPKRESVNIFVTLPHKAREVKTCAFLDKQSSFFDLVIQKEQFEAWKEEKRLKQLLGYDFFVALAPLMPAIATAFGRVLGPAGKMPSPQLGVLTSSDDKTLKEIAERLKKVARIKTKEASIKVPIGKESMSDVELAENAMAIYNAVVAALPKKNENIKNVMLKFTMSRPIKIK
jgi:large subunit ribosomal protein L1